MDLLKKGLIIKIYDDEASVTSTAIITKLSVKNIEEFNGLKSPISWQQLMWILLLFSFSLCGVA